MHINSLSSQLAPLEPVDRSAAPDPDRTTQEPTHSWQHRRTERRQIVSLQRSLKGLVESLAQRESPSMPEEGAEVSSGLLSAEASISEFSHALGSLFDDSQLIARPGPVLKILRDNIRSAVSSVFNRRGPGFFPPFRFGFNFPPDPSPYPTTSDATAAMLTAFREWPVEFTSIVLGEESYGPGIATAMHSALTTADAELSAQVGDLGIFLDTVA